MDINEHVAGYLDFYLNQASPPNYAVMLDGDWGAGKTFFIKAYQDSFVRKKPGCKFIYISLYGVSKSSDIDDQIFQQLHPVLSSKPAAIAAKIVRGAVKAGLKIDFFDDGDLSADISLPNIKASDILGKAKNATFIFDDLERCLMPIDRSLGYINHLVEHENYRAIVLANESEVKRSSQENEKYDQIKEKLIGRTFRIHSVADEALNSFIASSENKLARQVLSDNRELIFRVYAASSYNNLRSLKQAIGEFARFHDLLPKKAQEHSELLSQVVEALLVFTLELHKGAMSVDEIEGITRHAYSHILIKNEDSENRLGTIEQKYPQFSFRSLCPNDECWFRFFKYGSIPVDMITESIDNSSYFAQDNMSTWVKLWHYRQLEDETFSNVMADVEKQFSDMNYTKAGIIKHVVGSLIHLSRAGLSSRSLPETMKFISETILKMKSLDLVEKQEEVTIAFSDGYAGLQFMEVNSDEFKEICNILKEIEESHKLADLSSAASALISYVGSDTRLFWQTLSPKFFGAAKYCDLPILAEIDVKDFAAAYIRCPNSKKPEIAYAFNDRYEVVRQFGELTKELPWLEALRDVLNQLAVLQPRLTQYLVREFIDRSIEKSISLLQKQLAGLSH